MKLSLALALFASTSLLQVDGSNIRARSIGQKTEGRMLDEDGTVTYTVEDDCNYENLKDACDGCDLPSLFGKSEQRTADKVARLCAKALSHQDDPRKEAEHFGMLTKKGWQFDNEYFDGGTELNTEYETVSIDESSPDGFDIESIYEDIAEKKVITFPDDYLDDNFANCEAQSVMCCWVADRQDDNDGNCDANDCDDADPADNTDVCYVDLHDSPQSNHVDGGWALYKEDFDDDDVLDNPGEGDSHCHGFAWPKDAESTSHRYRGNNLFYVSMYDHLNVRGYVRNVPGAPMCSCVERMPVVSRSDCTEMDIAETYSFTFVLAEPGNVEVSISAAVEFNACTDNDLATRIEELDEDNQLEDGVRDLFDSRVVGECDDDVYDTFLNSKGYKRINA